MLSNNLLSQKVYWFNKLSKKLPETNLLLDSTRPFAYRHRDKSLRFNLPYELSTAITKLAKDSYHSTYWILLSILGVTLKKYVRSDNLIFGIPTYKNISNNDSQSKVIPLLTQVTSQLSFEDYLFQVKDAIIDAYNNQTYNFDELIQLLDISTTPNRCSIFDIVVLLENIHDSKDFEQLNNDLTICFSIQNEIIGGEIKFKHNLFDSEIIKTFEEYYIDVASCVIKNIQVRISDIDLVKEKNKQQLLINFNSNNQQYPIEQTIEQLFERQVEKTPYKIAAIHRGNNLTYQQLNVKANQIARLLQKLGLSKGEFVGILKDRDLNFLVAILAIYKAGGVYVPIDSNYPLDRIGYMLSNSQVKYLLTDYSLLNTLEEALSSSQELLSAICLDDMALKSQLFSGNIEVKIYQQSDFQELPSHNLKPINNARDPAYMLYTSGSTGLPKGAIVRHDGAINHIYAQFEALGLSEELTFLQSAPSSTDISVWQFLAPLVIGGKTVIVDLETVAFAEKLFNALKSEKITVVELVPALFRGLLEYTSNRAIPERELPDLQWMILSGESTSINSINQWLKIYPQIKIANAYGPTEAADDITQFATDKPLPENQRTVPIGKPLANLNLYVLDEKMQLLPIGAPGEICVSGIGVGDGYWNNEAKTKQAFVPNPFVGELLTPQNHDVIYKTGDLGRWLPNGNLEFLGRIDHQVKIRGFRVELGEIEGCLSQHSKVGENVVVIHHSETNGEQLIAYVVAKVEPVPSTKELRNFLEEKLPNHMIPAVFMMVDSIPLAPSGKIDRKALPSPNLALAKDDYLAPRNQREEMLITIWQEVLKIERIGINDNFFELGGHSLMATRVISRVKQVSTVELPLRSIFENPTIASLAEYLHPCSDSRGQQKIQPAPRTETIPLSFAQQRLWFLSQLEPHSPDYNLPAAFTLKGQLDIAALTESFNEIIERHEVLRTKFVEIDGQPQQMIIPELELELKIIELEESLNEEQIKTTIQNLALQPFDLKETPLFRLHLATFDSEEYLLIVVMHHIISDLWSEDVLIQEFASLYESKIINRSVKLPDLSIQYADFAIWQRDYLQGEVSEEHLAYWQQNLAGKLPVLEFSNLRNSSVAISDRGATYKFGLDRELSDRLQAFSQAENVTLFITLLTAFKVLLASNTNQQDIIVGSPIANRDRVELESLIGFFVNTLLLRTNLSGNPTFRELLGRVREITLNAYAHQALPFEKLVEVLQPDRKEKSLPFLQVWFTLTNGEKQKIKLPNLTIEEIDFDTELEKYQLRLDVVETPQGIEASFGYKTDLFTAEDIALLSESLIAILDMVTANHNISLAELITAMSEIVLEANKQKEQELTKTSSRKLRDVKRKAIRR